VAAEAAVPEGVQLAQAVAAMHPLDTAALDTAAQDTAVRDTVQGTA
jgi:hypothetical protein